MGVKWVPGYDLLANAARIARENPLMPRHDRGELYRTFISLAGGLQRLIGDRTIYLPTRSIAHHLRCDQSTVSRLRKFAIADGLLTVTKRHHFQSKGKSTATEFRFALELFERRKNHEDDDDIF